MQALTVKEFLNVAAFLAGLSHPKPAMADGLWFSCVECLPTMTFDASLPAFRAYLRLSVIADLKGS